MSTHSNSPDLGNVEAGFGESGFDSKDDTLVVTTPASGISPKQNVLDLDTVSDLLKHQGQRPIHTFEEKGKWRGDTAKLSYELKHKRNTFKPAGRWIRFQLWFNTYRKFWIFIVSLELAGMIAAGLGKFPYAHDNAGGVVIGNILAGVVVRNELFGRLLYVIVNTLFAKPSHKVAIVRFERGMQQGLLGRISRTAIWEYHVFGIVSASPCSAYHYMICGVQGDFTRKLVADRPTHLWTREVKFAGVGNTSTLYKRGIRICTGTGIGAALSTCLQSDQWFLIWIGSDADATLGPTIMGLIERGVGHRAIMWDTKKFGRPNTVELLAETFSLWKAEVVFITSNWQGNQEMMQGCKMRGIPAFGTLWDF
ncbi:unnamed protein product [Rhizoctonia solani]|uniref:Uncharacterized protein n=1 Tax=Rhizoctonia solani TaxID=456999 RepID=A0A8H3ABE2_9AGAM|nr:unnamed protein product [Rhizoctonia solani]